MRDLRTLNMVEGQKIESDETLKKIGDLAYRNLGTLAKMSLFDSGKALVMGSGLRVEPSSGMTVNIPSGVVFQKSGVDVFPCIQVEDQTVTIDAASGVPRVDIIEAQIKNIEDKNDYSQIATVSGSSVSITVDSIKRDIKYYLSCRKQTDTTDTTEATAGTLTGTVSIPGTIDLSEDYLVNISDGEDGSYQEIDCRGTTPEATTKTEIVNNINAAVGRTMASISGNFIVLTGEGTGIQSQFTVKPPVTDPDKDAMGIIFGISVGGAYKYNYKGVNAWFKLAEIDVGSFTTVLTGTEIRNLDEKSTWASEGDDIFLDIIKYSDVIPDNVIVESQYDFNRIFERVSANSYKIKDNIDSVYIKNIGNYYDVTKILSNGDTWGEIKTNNCKNIEIQNGSYLYVDDSDTKITINTNDCYVKGIHIKGDGSTTLSSSCNFTFSVDSGTTGVVIENCKVSDRIGDGTTSDFIGFDCSNSSETKLINCIVDNTNISSGTNKMIGFYYGIPERCIVKNINNTIYDVYGFSYCENLVNCIAKTLDTTSGKIYGFEHCINLSNCKAEDFDNVSDQLYGFVFCDQLSNCYAYDFYTESYLIGGFASCNLLIGCKAHQFDSASGNITGFASCNMISGCYSIDFQSEADGAKSVDGFDTCKAVSGCYAQQIDNTGTGTCIGFRSCNAISSCWSINIDSNSGFAYGFFACNYISSCLATDIDSVSGTAEGFNACTYGAAIYTTETTNGSNDYMDTADTDVTNKNSIPNIFT